jgi:hypothetical protein
MVQAAQIIAFPGVTRLPAQKRPRASRITPAEWDNTLLFEVIELSKHLQQVTAAIQSRIEELKSRHGRT